MYPAERTSCVTRSRATRPFSCRRAVFSLAKYVTFELRKMDNTPAMRIRPMVIDTMSSIRLTPRCLLKFMCASDPRASVESLDTERVGPLDPDAEHVAHTSDLALT